MHRRCVARARSASRGAPVARRSRPNARTSTTRSPYPKKVPRSVTATSVEPPSRTFSTAPVMASGVIHCPFLMLTGLPVLPQATSRSVCRERNAGTCKASTAWAAAAACAGSCTSVITGSPLASPARTSSSRPRAIPGPRAPASRDRLALSKLALKHTAIPSTRPSSASRSATRGSRSPSSATQGPAMRSGEARNDQSLTSSIR